MILILLLVLLIRRHGQYRHSFFGVASHARPISVSTFASLPSWRYRLPRARHHPNVLLLFSFSSPDTVHRVSLLLDGLPRHRPSPDPFCWHTSRLNGSITDGLPGPHQTPVPSCSHTSRHDDPILDGLRGPRQTPVPSSPLTYEPNPWLNPGQTSGALPNTQLRVASTWTTAREPPREISLCSATIHCVVARHDAP